MERSNLAITNDAGAAFESPLFFVFLRLNFEIDK